MKKILSIFLIFSIFHTDYIWSQTDFTRFLVKPNFTVIYNGKSPKLFPGGHDEKYWAIDKMDNKYKLRLKNALPSYAEVGFSIFSEAAGVPSLPVYPVLVRRGEQGIPTSSVARALDPTNKFLGLSGEMLDRVPATLQPVSNLEIFNVSKLTGKQIAEVTGQFIVNALVGNNDLQFGNGVNGNIGFTGKNFVTLDATQAFKFYPEESAVVSRFIGEIDKSLFTNLKDNELLLATAKTLFKQDYPILAKDIYQDIIKKMVKSVKAEDNYYYMKPIVEDLFSKPIANEMLDSYQISRRKDNRWYC